MGATEPGPDGTVSAQQDGYRAVTLAWPNGDPVQAGDLVAGLEYAIEGSTIVTERPTRIATTGCGSIHDRVAQVCARYGVSVDDLPSILTPREAPEPPELVATKVEVIEPYADTGMTDRQARRAARTRAEKIGNRALKTRP
jgi:hypothetical protein